MDPIIDGGAPALALICKTCLSSNVEAAAGPGEARDAITFPGQKSLEEHTAAEHPNARTYPCANCGNESEGADMYTLDTERSAPDSLHRGQSTPIDSADLCTVCHSFLVDALVRTRGKADSTVILRQRKIETYPPGPPLIPAPTPIEIPIAFPVPGPDSVLGIGAILESELRPLAEMMFGMQEEFRDAANTERIVAALVGGTDPDSLFVGQPVSIARAIAIAAEIRKGVADWILTEEAAATTGDEKPAN